MGHEIEEIEQGTAVPAHATPDFMTEKIYRYEKRNRRILSLTIAVMMLLVTLLPSSAAGITLTPIVLPPAALTRILSAHPELSIASSQPLYIPI